MKDLNHLEEDQLIRAVVDESDLPAAARGHLAECPSCQGRREALEKNLRRLGEMANRLAPSSQIRFPGLEAKTGREVSWGWNKGFVAGMAVGLVLLVAFWLSPLPWSPEGRSSADRKDLAEAERLMMEARILEEAPLSPFHRFVLGGPESGLDDGFLDFISPPFGGRGV